MIEIINWSYYDTQPSCADLPLDAMEISSLLRDWISSFSNWFSLKTSDPMLVTGVSVVLTGFSSPSSDIGFSLEFVFETAKFNKKIYKIYLKRVS